MAWPYFLLGDTMQSKVCPYPHKFDNMGTEFACMGVLI